MLKEIITDPQICDMGSGYGKFIWEKPIILREALAYLKNNLNSWGTIEIINWTSELYRKFDYDVHRGENEFYFRPTDPILNHFVKEITFEYCFMNYDIRTELLKDFKYPNN